MNIRKQKIIAKVERKEALPDDGIDIQDLIDKLEDWKENFGVIIVQAFGSTNDYDGQEEVIIEGISKHLESVEDFEERKAREDLSRKSMKEYRRKQYLKLKEEFEEAKK